MEQKKEKINFSYYTVKVILSVPWTQQSLNNCDNSYFAELMSLTILR